MVEDKISGPRKQGLSKREAKEDSFELVILDVQGRKISIFSLSGASQKADEQKEQMDSNSLT